MSADMRSNRMLLVGAAALTLIIVGAAVVYQSRDDGTGQQPVEVATSFLGAYGAFDAEQAITSPRTASCPMQRRTNEHAR